MPTTTVIDFNDAPWADLTDFYAAQGVTFQNVYVAWNVDDKDIQLGPQSYVPTAANPMIADFSVPGVSMVKIQATSVMQSGVRLEAYSGSTLVDADEFYTDNLWYGGSGDLLVYGSNITSVRFYIPGSNAPYGHGVVFDDLVFTTNAAPTLSPLVLAALEDALLVGEVDGADADGDALTYTLVSGPSHGSLDFFPDGTFTYTPSANFSGADNFIVRASDGTADSDSAVVTLNVGAVNDAPYVAQPLVAQELAAAETFSYSLEGAFADPEGQPLSLSATLSNGAPLPSWLSLEGDSLVGTPGGAEDHLSIQVTATDAGQLAASTTFDLWIGRTLTGGRGEQLLQGGRGSDLMSGGQGRDTLLGGAGDDVLSGDQGDDVLVGGAGADLFVFAKGSGADTVRDFSLGTDHLHLDGGIGVKSITTVGDSTLISLTNGGGSITLEHVVGLSLSDASSIFA